MVNLINPGCAAALARIEMLDRRVMLAAYAPDLAWGTGGRLAGTGSATLVGIHADRVYVEQTQSLDNAGVITTLERFAADGTMDPSFVPFSDKVSYDLAMVDDAGRTLLFADRDQTLVIRRLARDGSPDSRFARNGIVSIPLSWNTSIDEYSIVTKGAAIAADGSLYVLVELNHSFEIPDSGGSHRYFNSMRLIKLLPNRELDPSFAQSGVLTLSDQSAIDENLSVQNQYWLGTSPAGLAIVGVLEQFDFGDNPTVSTFTRYTSLGAIDTTYATNGQLSISGNVRRNNVGLDSLGRLVVGQLLTEPVENPLMTPRLLRFDARGRGDRSFGASGVMLPVGTNVYNSYLRGVVVRSDGTISARAGDVIVRLLPDGTPDSSFDDDGRAQPTAAVDNLLGELADGTLLTNSRTLNGREPAGIATIIAQADVSQSSSGALTIYGTPGDDTVTVGTSGPTNSYVVTRNGQQMQQTFTPFTSIHIELFGGNDTITTSFALPELDIPLHVLAGDGDDTIHGTTKDDTIDSGEGDDSVVSGNGFDRVALGGGSNHLNDTAGGASVTAHNADGAFVSQSWVNHVDIIGRGAYDGGGARLMISITGPHAVVISNNGQADTININASRGATVQSGGGNDTIISSGQSDDIITPSIGNDSVMAGAGNDTVGGESSSLEEGSNNNDYYDLGTGNDFTRDGYGRNTILGGDGDDSIRGGFFGDQLFGGAGNDTLRGGPRADTLDGGSGRDRLFGYAGNDQLTGGSNNDILVGGEGSDTLIGNQGDDLIVAGPSSNNTTSRNTIDGGRGTDSVLKEQEDDVLVSVEILLTKLD